MNRGVLIVWGLATAAIGGGAWWYLFSAGEVPVGQRPLGDAAAFREMLSPSTPAELAEAQRWMFTSRGSRRRGQIGRQQRTPWLAFGIGRRGIIGTGRSLFFTLMF